MTSMTTQIAVRLADDIVDQVDALVAAGQVRSRADMVTRALRRELRRQRAEEDLLRLGPDGYAELASFTDVAAATSTDLD
jgi:Arc/MetJ-type ribon-helix-helix transcriptional regulator